MRRRFLLLGLLVVSTFAAAACGGGGGGETSTGAAGQTGGVECGSGTISLMGIWVATEQKSIQAVLDGFEQKCPDVTVKYNPAGDNIVTVLATAVQGGNPPDLATIAQPGTIKEYADSGKIQPIDFAKDTISQNYSQAFRTRASSRPRPGTTSSRLRRRSRHPASRPTRSAVRTDGRSPTCSRTSISARLARTSTTSSPRTTSRGRTSRSRTP
jgi:spermidine/putrescine-binding protein